MSSPRDLDVAEVTVAVEDLCVAANYELPADVYDALAEARETEESAVGREVLAQLVENADIAATDSASTVRPCARSTAGWRAAPVWATQALRAQEN